MKKRFVFSAILSIVFSASLQAYDWSSNPGNGSLEKPYQISTPEQMNAIGLHLEIYKYKQQTSISLDF